MPRPHLPSLLTTAKNYRLADGSTGGSGLAAGVTDIAVEIRLAPVVRLVLGWSCNAEHGLRRTNAISGGGADVAQ